MPTTVIRESQELYKLAQPIIREHHNHLRGARVLYLFTSAKSSKSGRVRTGVAKKLTPEQRFLSSGLESVDEGYDFMVVINQTRWRLLTEEQQIAQLDHELCFCSQKETVNRRTGAVTRKWVTRGPDLEEFTEIVERHGLWNPDVKRLVSAGAQLALDLPFAELDDHVAPDGGRELSTELARPLGQVDGDERSYTTLGEDVTEETADGAAEGLSEAGGSSAPEEDLDETREAGIPVGASEETSNGHSGDWRAYTGITQTAPRRDEARE